VGTGILLQLLKGSNRMDMYREGDSCEDTGNHEYGEDLFGKFGCDY
jgi:hypothetical protein